MTCIMIIDDDELFVRSMEMALEKEGYEVISAHGGGEGLNRLKTAKPDLILLDMMMPSMDGWKTMQEINGTEALASMPVVMLSSEKPTSEIMAKKRELGIKDYVTKPFEIENLFSRITKALES